MKGSSPFNTDILNNKLNKVITHYVSSGIAALIAKAGETPVTPLKETHTNGLASVFTMSRMRKMFSL